MTLAFAAILFLAGYLVGAIPVGALVAHAQGIDIAQYGSGKTGTTNVLRTVGKRAAALVLLGDLLKGVVAVLLAKLVALWLFPGDGTTDLFGWHVSAATLGSLFGSAGALAGHVWSLYLRLVTGKWSGGRGVATGLGVILVVNPWVIVPAVLVGLPVIFLTRYVSLGSILGALAGGAGIVILVVLGQMDLLSILFLYVPLFIVLSHKDNIARLLSGTERRLGDRAKAS